LRVALFGWPIAVVVGSRQVQLASEAGKMSLQAKEGVIVSTTPSASSLFDEVATLFASAPSQNSILEFRPSQATIERANELLELNRANALDEASRRELDQFEQAELLMRLVKARIRASQNEGLPVQ
jgi:hypothetical protein